MWNCINLLPATSSEYAHFEGRMNKITMIFPWRYGIFEKHFMYNICSAIDRKLVIDFIAKRDRI